MAVRQIVTVPQKILRDKARKVTIFDEDLQTLLGDMVETMREAPGVGLAGPQINVPLRVIVVEFGDEEDETVLPKLYMVVNPEIVRTSQETSVGVEGCLSIPTVVGDVERADRVTLKGQNHLGKPFKIKAKGWLARIFQHEVDHLDGVLFVDRATRVWQPEVSQEDAPQSV
jgi:peptide deformylase